MRAEGGSSNMINGVSRQPAEVRLTSQLEESVNQFPTISRGLVPRNPTILKARVEGGLPAEAKPHLIDRDDSEQYNVIVSPSGIQVFDLSGDEKVVNAPEGYGYLAGGTKEGLDALTVQDHTFILNKARVVQKAADATPDAERSALVHIVQGDYFATYSINIDGVEVASVTTEGGPYGDSGAARSAERAVKPEVIARLLATGASGISSNPSTATPNLGQLSALEWEVELFDNVIHIKNILGNDFTITAEGVTHSQMRAHKGSTVDYTELPRKAPEGFLIKVSGSEDTNYDDYFVKFVKEDTDSEGRWKEWVAPGVQFKLDATTMPHLLVREADGTFTFKSAEWGEREVGDDDTNPWPSFVGAEISGMGFGDNRFALFSGEAYAQSRNGEFFNFWRASILTLLDEDPVDASISYPAVSSIYHAVPFSGETILFTQSVPFRLAKGETMTQKSVHYEHLIENRVSQKVRPVAAGSKLYFVNDTDSGCFVHEFSYDRAVDNLVAQSITDHVAGYIPTGASLMVADGDLNILALVADGEPTTIYTYKWRWIGNEKAQSAWQKWTVGAPVVAMRFYGEELVLITDRTDSWEILAINCHEAWTQGGRCAVYLDRQVQPTGVYDPDSNSTNYTLPYPTEGISAVARGDEEFGQRPIILTAEDTLVSLSGDWTGGPVAFGFEFDSYGDLSPLLHRSRNNQGQFGNALPGFETTIANVRFGTGPTAFFRAELERDYRKPVAFDFSAALAGTKTGTLGSLVMGRINKPVSVMAKSHDFRLRFGNIGPFPYSVMSYSWTGDARPISY